MDSAEEQQREELTAIQSIYSNEFIECPPPLAWKGAARLYEFILRIEHPENHEVSFDLRVKFPKTYPTLACPVFGIEKQTRGINNVQATKLLREINAEAQRLKGREMVLDIYSFAQHWLVDNIKKPTEVVGSLALQMNLRAQDEARERQNRELQEAEQLEMNRLREQQYLQREIEKVEQRMASSRNRQRSNSESTETPQIQVDEDPAEFMTETFQDLYTTSGVKFNTVKLYHPRPGQLGTVFMAEPILEDGSMAPALELYLVSFQSEYYFSTQGRKKLSLLEQEIKDLIKVRHPKLLAIYAVKLVIPGVNNGRSNGHVNAASVTTPQLIVLMEQAPRLTLHDLLEDCDSFKEERASDYAVQILTALNELHTRGFTHKCISTKCIALTSAENPSQPKSIKLCRASFHTKLLDLHRSNPLGPDVPQIAEETKIPDDWASSVVRNEGSLVYTKQRDIHDVGYVLIQMLMGLDVAERFDSPAGAIRNSSISPVLSRQILQMLDPPKNVRMTCESLLSDLNGVMSSPTTGRGRALTFAQNGHGLNSGDPRTPLGFHYGSPENRDYFRPTPTVPRPVSRYQSEFQELEHLGAGAFGRVYKARAKLDSRIYAVKKIRLKSTQNDTKILREVNALSGLSHRNIVRYYSSWLEVTEATGSTTVSESGTDSSTEEDNRTSVPDDHDITSERHLPVNGGFQLSIEDFDDGISVSRSSFPSIHFSRSSSPDTSEGGSSGDDSSPEDAFSSLFTTRSRSRSASGPEVPATPSAPAIRPPTTFLYIQMEFVERQTLKERIEEGLSEGEAWRLFQQLIDALVHLSSYNIIHRDIKPRNIFIDEKGDCKVGDFGLATSSLAAVDPSDVSAPAPNQNPDMTLEVGTTFYIAPEVQTSRRRMRGPRDHSKADMYSLGIVFFEMNFKFGTDSERVAVLSDLRKPSIIFPSTWDTNRSRQREIITWLLQHEPSRRPTAFELSNSPLLPTRVEDEQSKAALKLMATAGSKYQKHVLDTLFSQKPSLPIAFTYDTDIGAPEFASLNNLVEERLATIFRLRGAVDTEPPLLVPLTDIEQEKTHATYIDRRGNLVALPNNILIPFARLSARFGTKRIKRYHITNVFRPSSTLNQPIAIKAALFDIITPDLETGPTAAAAEIVAVASDVLDSFPDIAEHYDIHVSHSDIVECAAMHIPSEIRSEVITMLERGRMTGTQKRNLAKKGLTRSMSEEIDILCEAGTDDAIDDILSRLEKLMPTVPAMVKKAFEEVKRVIRLAQAAGVTKPIFCRPFMVGSHHVHFKGGVLVEVVRKNKPGDVLAAGGRYDALISTFKLNHLKPEPPIAAMGIQISVEKITTALEAYQSSVLASLIKEERSFGYWSPRRCDVYVVSYQSGFLQERLEIVSHLWKNNISADLMYELSLPDSERDTQLGMYRGEGILFTVYPRLRTLHGRNLATYKVKSLLKGTEVELSKQELVPWLQQQIAEQKRIDLTTSGAPKLNDAPSHHPVPKDIAANSHIHVVLPDAKKQRKNVKQLFEDKAFEKSVEVKNCFQNGMSVLAVDVSPALFEALGRNPSWITDDDAWKPIAAMFPAQQPGYAHQIRDTASKRKAEGQPYILLFAVKESRAQLLDLS